MNFGNWSKAIVAGLLLIAIGVSVTSFSGCRGNKQPSRGEGTADDEDRNLEPFEDAAPETSKRLEEGY